MALDRERPETCLSDLAIDRLIAGELAGGERDRADAHLGDCAACTRRRAELERDVATFGDRMWIEGAVQKAIGRTPARTSRGWRTYAAIALPLAAAASVAIWFALPREHAGEVRTKGSIALELAVRRGDGSTAMLGPDARVAPGEAVRFVVTTDRAGYLAIVGIDAARRVSRYLPDPGAAMPAIGIGNQQAQPGSIVLDNTPGAERFVAILCDQPADLDAVVRATEQAIAKLGDPRALERLPTPCAQASFVIEKSP